MANTVLGKSLCSDWFSLGQDFAVRTLSMETVHLVYFSFGAKAGKFKISNQNSEKKPLNIVILYSETTRRS